MRQIIFVIDSDYTYESYSRPRITAKEKYSDEIVVISNATASTIIQANFALENSTGLVVSQYLVPSTNKGSAYIETTSDLYADYANANVWSASLNQNVLSAISKFHRGRVGVTFNFKTIILGSNAITFKGYFGVSSDLPASSDAIGDYYICNVGSYASAVAGITFTYGKAAVWNGSAWVESGTYSVITNTTTVYQNVDPSVVGISETTDDESLEDALDAIGANVIDIATNATDIDALEQEDSDMKDGTSEFTTLNIGGSLLSYSDTQDVVEITYEDGTVGQLNKEVWVGVRNENGSALLNGEVAAINGVVGNQLSAVHADPSDESLHFKELGVVTMPDDIAVNATGKVTHIGEVNGIPVANLENTGVTYAENQELYVSVNGKLTNVEPDKPIAHVHAGWVLRVVGSTVNVFVLFVQVPHLNHLSDVDDTDLADGDNLKWDESSGTYVRDNRATLMSAGNPMVSIAYNGTSYLLTYTKFDSTNTSIVSLEQLKNFIGEATTLLSGLMSATDKANHDTMVALFGSEGGDADAIINTVREVLAMLSEYPEGVTLIDALADKQDVSNLVTEFQATPDDTHYPSEKLVDDRFDLIEAKTDFISVTQDVDLDTMESDISTNASDIDTLEGRADDLEADVLDIKQKDVAQDIEITTMKETLRKVSDQDDVSTADGTDIISLGSTVADAPLRVLAEGMALQTTQLLTNPSFDSGTTGWTLNDSTGSVSGGIYSFTATAMNGGIRQAQNIITGIKYYINVKLKTDAGLGEIKSGFAGVNTASNVVSSIYQNISGIWESTLTSNSTFRIFDSRASSWTQVDVDYAYTFNVTNLINAKAYSPIYKDTFDNLDDAEIKAQMDYWVANGDLPNDNLLGVSFNKRFRVVGKNLFDKKTYFANTQINGLTGARATFSGDYTTDYIPTIKGQTYIFSGLTSASQISGTLGGSITYATYDGNFNVISFGYKAYPSFTIVATGVYMAISVRTMSDFDTLQIELGSSATDYVPYVHEDLFLQKSNIGYHVGTVKDRLYYQDGKYYYEEKVGVDVNDVVQSATTWTTAIPLTNTQIFIKSFTGLLDLVTPASGAVLSKAYLKIGDIVFTIGTVVNLTNNDTENTFAIWTSSQQIAIRVNKTTYPNSASFEAYLQANDVTFIYELATPIQREVLALGNINGFSKGSVYVDTMIADVDIYDTNINITQTDQPISELVSIVRLRADGSQVALDVADATVAGDGLSFTHTDLVADDPVSFTYIPTGDFINGLTTISYYEHEDDLRFPVTALPFPASGRPDFDATNIALLFPQNNTGEVIYFIAQMPHDRIPDSPIEPHVHCRLTGAGQPVMKMDYRWYNPSGTTIPSATTYTMNVNTATWSTGTISNMIYGSASISGVGKDSSSILIAKVYRDDNAYTGDLIVDEIDIHYYRKAR